MKSRVGRSSKLNSEVERLRKINQKYYEKLIDTSVQEKQMLLKKKLMITSLLTN